MAECIQLSLVLNLKNYWYLLLFSRHNLERRAKILSLIFLFQNITGKLQKPEYTYFYMVIYANFVLMTK